MQSKNPNIVPNIQDITESARVTPRPFNTNFQRSSLINVFSKLALNLSAHDKTSSAATSSDFAVTRTTPPEYIGSTKSTACFLSSVIVTQPPPSVYLPPSIAAITPDEPLNVSTSRAYPFSLQNLVNISIS